MRLSNKKENKEQRRYLRTHGTPEEAVLWTQLKSRQISGTRWRRQFSIGDFVVDFYCPAIKLAIELDGAYHYNVGGAAADDIRTSYLNRHGVTVLRFENREIWDNLQGVISVIKDAVNSLM